MMSIFIELNTNEKLNELFEQSKVQPIVLFKHSLTCPISANVYDEISRADAEINLVVVQKSREISNEIAQKTGIRHESPQAIIIKNGKPVFHASHYDITAENINNSLESD